jgi:hypothetical protein
VEWPVRDGARGVLSSKARVLFTTPRLPLIWPSLARLPLSALESNITFGEHHLV